MPKLKKTKKTDTIEETDIAYELDIWSIVNSINSNKPYDWEEIKGKYDPYTINKALSYFHDTISYADDMNKFFNIPPEVQYIYLINTIRAKKRFTKWAKTDLALIDLIRKYYGYNVQKAEDALKILTPEQIKMIQKKQETGGLK